MITRTTRAQALQNAKDDPWCKAHGGFALVQHGSSRFEEENEYDYYPTGQSVPAGWEIVAKYRHNPNRTRNQWQQIA